MYDVLDAFLRLFRFRTSLTVSFLHITKVLSLVSAAKLQTRASPPMDIWQELIGASGLNTTKQ